MSEKVREWKLRPMQVPNDLRVALVIGEHNFDDMTEVVEKRAYDRLAEINKVLVEALECIQNYQREPILSINGYIQQGHTDHDLILKEMAAKAIAKAKEMGK